MRLIFKRILFLLVQTNFFNFLTDLLEWKQFFIPVKLYFSTNLSFWLVETNFLYITNLVVSFRAFFCWWTPFLKLGVNQFSSFFSITNSGINFSGKWKLIFYRMLHSGDWKHIFCLVFFYLEQILWWWKPLFKLR